MYRGTTLTVAIVVGVGIAALIALKFEIFENSQQDLILNSTTATTTVINTEIERLLDAGTGDEFEREKLTQQLVSADISWTEDQLKQIIPILWGKILANPRAYENGIALIPYDSRINEILGDDGYIAYLKKIDPAYQRMRDAVDQPDSDITEQELEDAYREYVSYEVLKAQLQSEGPSEELQRLHKMQNGVLVSIIGIQSNDNEFNPFIP